MALADVAGHVYQFAPAISTAAGSSSGAGERGERRDRPPRWRGRVARAAVDPRVGCRNLTSFRVRRLGGADDTERSPGRARPKTLAAPTAAVWCRRRWRRWTRTRRRSSPRSWTGTSCAACATKTGTTWCRSASSGWRRGGSGFIVSALAGHVASHAPLRVPRHPEGARAVRAVLPEPRTPEAERDERERNERGGGV